MPVKDALGDRMKSYENESRIYLARKAPVIIRVDGKAFHTFTRGFEKPFDDVLGAVMQKTMLYLCENIQGAVLGYTQSDEITIVVIDYQQENSDAWFGYNLQKMASVAASQATWAFGKAMFEVLKEFDAEHRKVTDWGLGDFSENWDSEENKKLHYHYWEVYHNRPAMFDARCFTIPDYEVINCLIWRQQDAIRNSIQALGQANFSHRELQGLHCGEIKEKLFDEKGISWKEYPEYNKQGICAVKFTINYVTEDNEISYIRRKWKILPIDFMNSRQVVDNLVKEKNYDEGNETGNAADAAE